MREPDRRSQWQVDRARLVRLLGGLWLFGTGEACVVHAGLGNSPWTVFAQGVSLHSPMGIGAATIATSVVVLLLWLPLRQPPGAGTVLNAVLVGVAIGVMLPLLGARPHGLAAAGFMLGGIATVAAGSGLYLTAGLGPGPRDGLMTGLHRRTGRSVRLVRGAIEGSVLIAGFALGGHVGIGTVAFATLIGPGVQLALGLAGAAREPLRAEPVPADAG